MFSNTVFHMSVDAATWMKAASIRALRTMAQTAISVIGSEMMIYKVDWRMVLASSVIAGGVSFLTSVASLPEVKTQETEGKE